MILYQGPSMLDGRPIVAIATAGTDNRKTGDMVQTWILRADMDPMEASAARADSSVCGDCPHRRSTGGSCYVTLHQAPLSVWRAWWRGAYAPDGPNHAKVKRALQAGTPVRLGAYGDPAAVPLGVWLAFVQRTTGGWTGYTHQWRRPEVREYRSLLMASADSPGEAHLARSQGWRAFTVLAPGDVPPARSFECLADARGTSCADCQACRGADPGREVQAADVWIRVHGALAGRFEAARGRRVDSLRVLA